MKKSGKITEGRKPPTGLFDSVWSNWQIIFGSGNGQTGTKALAESVMVQFIDKYLGLIVLTHPPQVPNMCISESGQH